MRKYWFLKYIFVSMMVMLLSQSSAVLAYTSSSGSMSYHINTSGVVRSITTNTNRIVIDGKTFAISPHIKVFKYVPSHDGSQSGLRQTGDMSNVRVGETVDYRQEGSMISEIHLKRW